MTSENWVHNFFTKFCLKTFVVWKPWCLKLSHVCHHHLTSKGNCTSGLSSDMALVSRLLGLPGNPKPLKVGSSKTKPNNKPKQRFKSVFQTFATVSSLLEHWLLNFTGSRSFWRCCLLNPWCYQPKPLVAERWAILFQKDSYGIRLGLTTKILLFERLLVSGADGAGLSWSFMSFSALCTAVQHKRQLQSNDSTCVELKCKMTSNKISGNSWHPLHDSKNEHHMNWI